MPRAWVTNAIQLAMGDPMSDNLQVVEGLNISYYDKLKFVGHGLTECHWAWVTGS
jgi:hypothetical protein